MTDYERGPILFPPDGGYDRVRMRFPEERQEPARDLGGFATGEAMNTEVRLPDDFDDEEFVANMLEILARLPQAASMTQILSEAFGPFPVMDNADFVRLRGIVWDAVNRGQVVVDLRERRDGRKIRVFGLPEEPDETATEELTEEPEASEAEVVESEIESAYRTRRVPQEEIDHLDKTLKRLNISGGGSKRGARKSRAHKKLSGRPNSRNLDSY